MTPAKIAEAQRLCEAATPGSLDAEPMLRPEDGYLVTPADKRKTPVAVYMSKEDAEFFAAARDLLPKALAHIQAQSEQLRQAQAAGAQLRTALELTHTAIDSPWVRSAEGIARAHGMEPTAEECILFEKALIARDDALSSTAPAPCPECGGSRHVEVWTNQQSVPLPYGGHMPVAQKHTQPCPRCSAQPAPCNTAVTVEPHHGTTTTADCTGLVAQPAPSGVVVPREIAEWVHSLLTRRLVPWKGKFTSSPCEERDKRWVAALDTARHFSGVVVPQDVADEGGAAVQVCIEAIMAGWAIEGDGADEVKRRLLVLAATLQRGANQVALSDVVVPMVIVQMADSFLATSAPFWQFEGDRVTLASIRKALAAALRQGGGNK